MTDFDTAMLQAYLRGTLPADQMDAIDAALETDMALVARLEALADGDDAASAAVRDAFAPVEALPVPARLTAAVYEAAPAANQPIDLGTARAAGRAVRWGAQWGWPQFGAMAASLAVGVLASRLFLTPAGDGSALVIAAADGPRLTASLATVLDTAASGETRQAGPLGTAQLMISFRNGDGQLCRQFAVTGQRGVTDAVSCRDGKGWRVEAMAPRPAAPGEIRTAAGDAAPAVLTAVDGIIVGDVLLGEAEAAALKAR